jgi:hypothetical protein
MRKLIPFIVVLILIALIAACYPRYVQKPVKDGVGPLAVYIEPKFAAPEYHSPLDYWQSHHMHIVNRGDIAKTDCLYCHEPERSCNNCHGYVGADPIVEETP